MKITQKMFTQTFTEIKTPIKRAKVGGALQGRKVRKVANGYVNKFLGLFKKEDPVEREIQEIKKDANYVWKKFVQVVCVPALVSVSLKFQYHKANANSPIGVDTVAYNHLNSWDKKILRLYSDQVSIFKLD